MFEDFSDEDIKKVLKAQIVNTGIVIITIFVNSIYYYDHYQVWHASLVP